MKSNDSTRKGLLIINADDWGRDQETTDRTLDCVLRGTVSSVSAMVFMEDSERAAAIAREHNVDAGLHLNFTTPFTSRVQPELAGHQERIASHLGRHRLAQVLFHPGLVRSFEYVVSAQLEEYHRLYDGEPKRIDGHHHMHLCSNVLLGRLLPAGTAVRRNFSFQPGEKGAWNRLYRQAVDKMLARRHRVTDFFFSLPPMDPSSRVTRIFSLAHDFTVEVETHPANPDEYGFLTADEIFRWADGLLTAAPSANLHRGSIT